MELDSNVKPIMLQATDEKNNRVRNNKDWLNMKGRAIV